MAVRLVQSMSPSLLCCILSVALSFCVNLYVIIESLTGACKLPRDDAEQSSEPVYKDEDGVAIEEPQKQHRALTPTWLCILAAILGTLMSLALVLHDLHVNVEFSIESIDDWLGLANWILLDLLTWLVFSRRSTLLAFKYGLASAAISVAAFIASTVRLHENLHEKSLDRNTLSIAGTSVEAVSAFMLCIACSSLPRRPTVEVDGHVVDRQYSVSALSYWTMAWSTDVLSLARTKHSLGLEDLPLLHHKARSSYLLNWFGDEAEKRPLWKTLLSMHSGELIFQSVFAIIQATVQFAPQLAMYRLLQLLEQSQGKSFNHIDAWFLIVSLGVAMIFSAWGDIWSAWIGYSRLALQVRSELSSLIFAKATRRKDVKISQAKIAPEAANGLAETIEQSEVTALSANRPSPAQRSQLLDNDIEKTRQSTINLVSVDAKRVSDFLRFHYLFVQVATKFAVSMLFLVNLLGWLSVLAGFTVFFIALPLNIWASKRFTNAQGQLMEVRDRKLMVLTEALQGIRQIKFSAQEAQWQNRISSVRSIELHTQWKVFCYDIVLIFCWILGPILLSAVALSVHAAANGYLSASVAFTSITIFSSLEFTLAVIPEFAADGLEAWVSAKRIEDYLGAPECKRYLTDSDKIAFDDAIIAWPSDMEESLLDRFTLRGLNLRIPKNELTVINGPTGSGKSLLLAALIGEADLLDGMIRAPAVMSHRERHDDKVSRNGWIIESSVAFVAQIPWIENTTIKNNILFGLPYDRGRYNKVIECCALKKDFAILDDGDETDIGFNGINLSGGQRWRVTFARALYSRAGILVLDDIFSAVDAHVGRQLFDDALTGDLGQSRTRILATHHVSLVLPKTKYLVTLGDGTVTYVGSPEAFERSGGLEKVGLHSSFSPAQVHEQDMMNQAAVDEAYDLRKVMSAASHRLNKMDSGGFEGFAGNVPKQFVEDEVKEKGSIKFEMYNEYFWTSGGIWFWAPIIALFVGHQSLTVGRSFFVSIWTRSYESETTTLQPLLQTPSTMSTPHSTTSSDGTLSYYLGVYLGLSIILCITGTLRYFTVYTRSIEASRTMFEKMTFTILRTPLRWLDTVPVGRVLNRFTADFEVIDSRLGGDLGLFVYEAMQIVSIIIAAVFVSLLILPIALVLLVACGLVTSWYLPGAREVKRLESITKSPIFELFGATLNGIGTIRAFDKIDAYIERMAQNIDGHARAFWHLWLFNRWGALNLNIVGALFATAVAIFVAFADIDASLAGFALGFALQYSSAVVWTTRFYSNIELAMNAVERISEYSKLPIEDQGGRLEPSAAWPTDGRLEVHDLVVGYAPNLPSVLKGLTFSVERNQRVGVVGRTGAGKSSLTLALFRFLEAREGQIFIDGVDIADIPLQILRSRLAIIPQDPVLFSGNVRSNLDPFNDHTDAELKYALQRIRLIDLTGAPSQDGATESSSSAPTASNPFLSLASPISESGLNLSQGQRQLLCLARAIVRRPKLLVLDEATSAVDMETDFLIQRSIREEFQGSTLLVIAHRLSTIVDFDRVLVMAEGKGVEFGSPKELMAKDEGVFRGLVVESGEKARLMEVIEREA